MRKKIGLGIADLFMHPFLDSLTSARKKRKGDALECQLQIEAISRSQMMLEFGMDGTIIKANENYMRAFGYNDTDLSGRDYSVFVPEDCKQSSEYKEFWLALRAGLHQAGQFCRVDKNGNRVWIEATYDPVMGVDGKPTKVIELASDVTWRVKTQTNLDDANTRATLAIKNSGIGIWSWNISTGELSWDSSMYRLHGVTVGNDMRESYMNWASFLHPQDRKLIEQALRDCVNGTKSFDRVFRVIWDDGSVHHVHASGRLERNGDALRMVGASWDVTEMVQVSNTTQRAMEIAEYSNRITSEFLEQMSHAIRTPMNSIMGMTRLALSGNPNPKLQGYLSKVDEAGRSVINVMDEIKDISKSGAEIHSMERVSFSLEELLNNLVDSVRQRAQQKGISLTLSVPEGTPLSLIGDPLRLGRILANLVDNAIEYTKQGEVIVMVAAENAITSGVRFHISVCDTGIGMTSKQVDNLSQSFTDLDGSFSRKDGGTGLGLAISKQLCEQMDGALSVESELGKGSAFHFTAKFLTSTECATSTPATKFNFPQRNSVLFMNDREGALESRDLTSLVNRRVLLVEDDEINRDLAIELLADLGIDATIAVNGRECVDRMAGARFDLILMDITMPVMDGVTATKLIRADGRFRDMPIVAMTAHAMSGDRERSLYAGMNDHLTKPISPETLTEMLIKWMPARVDQQLQPETASTSTASVSDDIPELLPRVENRINAISNKLTRPAAIDTLTGLANRDRFEDMLAYEYARHARSRTEFSLIMLDIDQFKRINETFGHVCGDDCLRQIARAIGEVVVRETDTAARFGGEQFVVLLPETSLEGALIIAERIRLRINELALPAQASTIADHVTASLGVISARHHHYQGGSPVSILSQADEQLYAAKVGGRNRVCSAYAS